MNFDEISFLSKLKMAKNTNSTPEILEKLSDDISENIRIQVCINKNCPIHILEKLSDDEVYYVKTSVVKNIKCTYEILKKLYKYDDDDKNLKEIIAIHPNWKIKDFI